MARAICNQAAKTGHGITLRWLAAYPDGGRPRPRPRGWLQGEERGPQARRVGITGVMENKMIAPRAWRDPSRTLGRSEAPIWRVLTVLDIRRARDEE